MVVETSNTKNCNKANVCKYHDKVLEESERLIDEVSTWSLPLSVNVNCREWADRKTSAMR